MLPLDEDGRADVRAELRNRGRHVAPRVGEIETFGTNCRFVGNFGGADPTDSECPRSGVGIKQFMRTPQLLVVQALTSTMFLLIFRYVFGGAIQTGDVEYVDFLIPALAAVSGLFASGAVGVA